MAARIQKLQTSFNSGVLAPEFAARTDIEHYFQGARQGVNVVFPKEGGAKGRWGLVHGQDLSGEGRFIPFATPKNNGVQQNYVLHFHNGRMYVLRDGVYQGNLNGSGLDYITTLLPSGDEDEYDYAQIGLSMVFTHRTRPPEILTFTPDISSAGWAFTTMTLNNLPKYDFDDSLSGTPTSHVVDITFTGFADGDRYKLTLDGFDTAEISYSGISTAANERRLEDELIQLPSVGFDPTTITAAFQAGTTYRVTFSGESADAYEPMTGRNVETAGASISTTTITNGVPRREEIFNFNRLYARRVMYYENRLWLASSTHLPQLLLGSVTGSLNDFRLGSGNDNDAVFVLLQTDDLNLIEALYPGRNFQLFTAGGEYFSPDRPMTPAPALPRQSKFGIAENIKPVEVDGATIFVSKDLKSIREYLFLWAEEAYNATSLTVMASHLHNNIQSVTALTSTSDEEDSYVITTNGPKGGANQDDQPPDGSGAILNTLRSQNISAWSQMLTREGDKIKQAVVSGEEIYYLVERQRNGATVYTCEYASFETRMDASLKVTAGLATTMNDWPHLAGETVQILVDGAPVADQTVSASGELTFATAPTTSVEAGYFVPPVVETMPLTADLGGGPLLGANKRIQEIRVQVKDSLGIIANGEKIPDKILGTTLTGTPDNPVTGILVAQDLGWTEGDATITLTQEQPLPFHVLAVAGMLEVGRQ